MLNEGRGLLTLLNEGRGLLTLLNEKLWHFTSEGVHGSLELMLNTERETCDSSTHTHTLYLGQFRQVHA